MTRPAMIVAAQPEAAEAGARVLQRGGNAVDAAIAAALVQGVVDPQMCGIAGFGSCHLFLPSRGVHCCIDFHGKTPLAAHPAMWEDLLEGETRDGFGFILKGRVNDLGYQSITTPGALKAYFEAATEFGSWDWADICAPAVARARKGFTVRPHVDFWWRQTEQLGRTANRERNAFSATGRAVYFHEDGRSKGTGDRVVNPDLAHTLERVARNGSDIFYTGEIAEEIDADMRANGGLMTAADLAAYRTIRTEPIWTDYRGRRVASNRPPGGGVQVLQILNQLEHFNLAAIGHNSTEYLRVVSEAMKRATRDKGRPCRRPGLLRRAAGLAAFRGLRRGTGGRDRARRTGVGGPDCAGAAGHNPCRGRGPRRRHRHHDPFARHAVGRHHAGAGLHV